MPFNFTGLPHSLLTLDLSFNWIGVERFSFESLPSSLSRLVLNNNYIGCNYTADPNAGDDDAYMRGECRQVLPFAFIVPFPSSLSTLDLHGNLMIGLDVDPRIPLRTLDLSKNRIGWNEVPINFSNLTTLQSLDLSNNQVGSNRPLNFTVFPLY